MIEKYGHIIEFCFGSGTPGPNHPGGMHTSDIKLWMRIDKSKWFRPTPWDRIDIINLMTLCSTESRMYDIFKMFIHKEGCEVSDEELFNIFYGKNEKGD